MKKVKLAQYNNEWYQPGHFIKIVLWYFTNMLFLKSSFPFSSSFKVMLLRLFGAKVGDGVVIKNNVNIKSPWFLEIGDYTWIGEKVWIDNLANITIGDNVCLSQQAYLLTGSHDYKKENFDLIVGSIVLEEGVWIGARATVCLNVICKSHSILTTGSVATKSLEAYGVYQGNPALLKRKREMI